MSNKELEQVREKLIRANEQLKAKIEQAARLLNEINLLSERVDRLDEITAAYARKAVTS